MGEVYRADDLKLGQQAFNLMLTDIKMPGMDGLDVLKQLKIEKPHLPVLILTIHPESQYALRIIKAGASGYLTKASADEELIRAIRKVHRGGKYISPSLAEKIAFALDEDASNPYRPWRVLRVLADPLRRLQAFWIKLRRPALPDRLNP